MAERPTVTKEQLMENHPDMLEEYEGMAHGCNGTRASDMQVGGNHYKGMVIQPAEFLEKNQIGWCEGNAIKYICRHSQKGQKADVLKAIHYLELILEWEYGNVEDTDPGQ